MASSRGILNIQSLNELTSENSITEIVVGTPILQAEHLASRPGYLALAVDGATPRSRFGRLHRRRHSGTIAGKGCWLVYPQLFLPGTRTACAYVYSTVTNHSTIPTM